MSDWRALCYALYLRNQKDPPLSSDEIFYRVAERYPRTAARLQAKLAERSRQRVAERNPKENS
jgi:hypothetical protein